MKKIVRLTENDLTRIVKKVLKESYEFDGDYYGTFDDEQRFDRYDRLVDDYDDYDEEEFEDFESYSDSDYARDPKNKWVFNRPGGKDWFDTYRDKYGPLKIRRRK